MQNNYHKKYTLKHLKYFTMICIKLLKKIVFSCIYKNGSRKYVL